VAAPKSLSNRIEILVHFNRFIQILTFFDPNSVRKLTLITENITFCSKRFTLIGSEKRGVGCKKVNKIFGADLIALFCVRKKKKENLPMRACLNHM
jgi:hypothetical protein